MSTSTDPITHTSKANPRAADRSARSRPTEATNPSFQTAEVAGSPTQSQGLSQESFSAFTEVLGHRMGNLLSGVEGYTDLLLPALERSEDREHAFRILEGVSRMNGILKDLRHYQEALDVRTHRMDATSILSGLMPLLADSEAIRLRIETSIPDGISAQIDERLIRQALLSIIRNAFEALSSTHDPVSLRADVIQEEGIIRFRVFSATPIQDPQARERLFEPFFTTKSANLGLGLTMARRIFEAHGGDVTLSSSEHEIGTELSCSLPFIR